jgi:uncharacterized zinc-type alcohol dehydrogenase-like protein
MTTIHAYAAQEKDSKLEPFEYDVDELGKDQIEIDVKFCGVCHSDLSMLDNDWGMTEYPFVPGHEVVGTIAAVGDNVTHLQAGQTVGLGWFSGSCMTCNQCMGGDHNLCSDAQGTIIGRHGGFADKVRCQASWATALPDDLDASKAGPLFCGGITVFNPIVQNNIRPTDRVGVVGIGGLGHLALQFLNAWGCEVTAFSTSPDKEDEARDLGAHHFVNSRDDEALEKLAGTFDMVLVTVNADLPWDAYVNTLAPKGKLHLVGAAEAVKATVFPLILGQKSLGGSPVGSPATTRTMIEFCARHGIAPMIETFKMKDVNDAMDHLREGKPRYRIVLEN